MFFSIYDWYLVFLCVYVNVTTSFLKINKFNCVRSFLSNGLTRTNNNFHPFGSVMIIQLEFLHWLVQHITSILKWAKYKILCTHFTFWRLFCFSPTPVFNRINKFVINFGYFIFFRESIQLINLRSSENYSFQ